MTDKTAYLQRLEALRQLLQDLDAPMDSMAERLRLLGILITISDTIRFFQDETRLAQASILLNLDRDIDYALWTDISHWYAFCWMGKDEDLERNYLQQAWNKSSSVLLSDTEGNTIAGFLPSELEHIQYDSSFGRNALNEALRTLSGPYINTSNLVYAVYQALQLLCQSLSDLHNALTAPRSAEEYRRLSQSLYMQYSVVKANSEQYEETKKNHVGSCDYDWLSDQRIRALEDLHNSAFMQCVMKDTTRRGDDKAAVPFSLPDLTPMQNRFFYRALQKLCTFTNDRFDFSTGEENVAHYICLNYASLSPSDQQAFFRFRHLVTLIQSDMDTLPSLPTATNKKPKPTPQKNRNYMTFSANGINSGHITLLYQHLMDIGWIPRSTPADEFQRLFTGKSCVCRITWTGGGKGNLRELFRIMREQQLITIPGNNGLETILEAHFVDEDGNYLTGLNSSKPSKKSLPIINECIRLLQQSFDFDS